MSDLEDDELDINARPRRDIGARILILATLCRRALLETEASTLTDPDDDPDAERFDHYAWLLNESIAVEVADSEGAVFSAPVGSLTSQEITEATWRIEALHALSWSAGHIDTLPDPWIEAGAASLLTSIPAPFDATAPFIESVTIRDDESLALERERAELWLWRASLAGEQRRARGADRRELKDIVADVARSAGSNGVIVATDRDFLVEGAEFASIPVQTADRIAAVSAERLHALNWACGFGRDWDDVPLDV